MRTRQCKVCLCICFASSAVWCMPRNYYWHTDHENLETISVGKISRFRIKRFFFVFQTFLPAPSDGDEILYFPLNGTKMQTVIFYPSRWNGHICMRIELYGCVPGIHTLITNKIEHMFLIYGHEISRVETIKGLRTHIISWLKFCPSCDKSPQKGNSVKFWTNLCNH